MSKIRQAASKKIALTVDMTVEYERAVKERILLLLREKRRRMPIWTPLPGPQTMAYQSKADIIGYGGAAGGGKTDLAAGMILTRSQRALFMRREKAQTEGVMQRLTEIVGDTKGYNSQKSVWRIPDRALLELGGLDNPGDETRWQGRPHDLKVYDEVTEQREAQVRFTMGWNRSNNPDLHPCVLFTFNPPTTSEGRWVIDFFGPWLDKNHKLYPTPPGELRYCAMLPDKNGKWKDSWLDSDGLPLSGEPFVLVDSKTCYDFNPKDHNPESIIAPKSRTFIPARVTDNPYYMASGYMSTLQSLPEPLRSQMLYGDFSAGVKDDIWQVIPTAWVEAAMARWSMPAVKTKMDSMGVDVARGGADNTIIARRHGNWYDMPLIYPGRDTPDGPTVAGLVIASLRDRAPIHIDVIGVGSSPYDFLKESHQHVIGVNVAEAAFGSDKSGRLRFANQRSESWWSMREALDPSNNLGIALPPDEELKRDLCAPSWRLKGKVVYVESRDEIIAKTGRSPDYASAFLLAMKDTPTMESFSNVGALRQERMSHDPYQRR